MIIDNEVMEQEIYERGGKLETLYFTKVIYTINDACELDYVAHDDLKAATDYAVEQCKWESTDEVVVITWRGKDDRDETVYPGDFR